MTELHKLSIKEKLKGLKNSTFSSQELTESYLKRIKKLDNKINSFITVLEDTAVKSAKNLTKGIYQVLLYPSMAFQ